MRLHGTCTGILMLLLTITLHIHTLGAHSLARRDTQSLDFLDEDAINDVDGADDETGEPVRIEEEVDSDEDEEEHLDEELPANGVSKESGDIDASMRAASAQNSLDDDVFNSSDDDDDGEDENGEPVIIEQEDEDNAQGQTGEDDDKVTSFVDEASVDDDTLRRKRRQALRRQITLSRETHPLEVSLVETLDAHRTRVKRTSFTQTASTWPNHIPYVFGSSFDMKYAPTLLKVLAYLESRLCVKFTEEADHDTSNPNWFKEKGYSTNAYINFEKKAHCVAYMGRGGDTGPRLVSPCTSYSVMMHEVLHTLGALHDQSFPNRDRYITVHKGNIFPSMVFNFQSMNQSRKQLQYKYFDSHSTLMYYPSDFSVNGQETFNYLRPDMGTLDGSSSFEVILSEMNKNYRCAELHCSGEKHIDCGIGYLGYNNDKCACVCPDGYDVSENCQTVINGVDASTPWPDTPFTLFKAGDKCPPGTEEGKIPMHGFRSPRMSGPKMSTSGWTLNLETCSKKSSSGQTDFSTWPLGSYCIGKPAGVDCGDPFTEGSFSVTTRSVKPTTGAVGDVTVAGTTLTAKYCCMEKGSHTAPIQLPNTAAFRMPAFKYCQEVEGMSVSKSVIDYFGRNVAVTALPFTRFQPTLLRRVSCYYEPIAYGCSKLVNLDANTKSVTVTSPGFGVKRNGNTRCFWGIHAPEKSRIKITFNSVSMYKNDILHLKRFHKWQSPYRIEADTVPTEMVSESNFMFAEYWSAALESSVYKGVSLTFDLLPSEDLCYDYDTNGADYAGDREMAETYDKCMPWKDAINCSEFPITDGEKVLQLFNSGNKCRNPQGVMSQPWCYSFINDTMCIRRYCDACNEMNAEDKLPECASKIAADPTFCTESLARFGCFKSCQMTIPSYNKDDIKCSRPTIPAGVTSSQTLADEYDVGQKVTLACAGQASDIECTTHGWSLFSDQCVDAQCIDASQLCQRTLELFPEFCVSSRYTDISNKLCKKTCGHCEDDIKCSAPQTTDTTTRVSSEESIGPGEVVTFACNDGFYLASGSEMRACSISGALLGEELVCQQTPMAADVNLIGIRQRRSTLAVKHAMILDGPGWNIPIDGTLTKWYYYCKASESIALLVYRRTSVSDKYKLIGYNEDKCVPFWPWTFNVPADKQIQVQKGDLIGVFSVKRAIAAYSCYSAPKKQLVVRKFKVSKLSTLVSTPEPTFKDTCSFISIGAHIEP